MSEHNRIVLIKDLGEMLETIVKGTETEHSDIFTNYLERIYKITKVFMNNIEKEIAELKLKDDDSDDEESFKKFINNTNDVDSVSEYEDYNSDDEEITDITFVKEDTSRIFKQTLTELDITMKNIYSDIRMNNFVIFKKID
jgi:hypothetical protein